MHDTGQAEVGLLAAGLAAGSPAGETGAGAALPCRQSQGLGLAGAPLVLHNPTANLLFTVLYCSLSLVPGLLLTAYLTLTTLSMFIPIMGRAGSAVNPDIIIGCQVQLLFPYLNLYISFTCLLVDRPNNIFDRFIMTSYLTTLVCRWVY